MENKKPFDCLIVGAGLFGATVAHRARQSGKRCLVVDRRAHTGGNIHQDEMAGIAVHSYGPHIFHTSNPEVWKFVTSLVRMNAYVNSPQANNGGRLFHLPFNLNTFEEMWGVHTADEARRIIDEQRAEVVRQLGGREPANLEEQALLLVGRDIYETLIKGYTEKQWGRACMELPAFIIRRLPVRFTRDNNYFNDPWQGVPELGYNVLIDRLLEGTEVRLGVDYAKERASLNELADKVVFTGSIDEYFDFRLGRLEYRTVRFEHEVLDVPDYQHNAVVNFTSKEVPWTRIIEHKHFVELDEAGVRSNPRTVISREYSVEWQPGMEPFYPLNNERNTRLYGQYAELARAEKNVVFGGRLAEYRYYDMDKVIEKAMQMTI